MDTSAYFTSFMYAPNTREYNQVTSSMVPHYGVPPSHHGSIMDRLTPPGGRGASCPLLPHASSQGSLVTRPTCLFANKHPVSETSGGSGQPMGVAEHHQVRAVEVFLRM